MRIKMADGCIYIIEANIMQTGLFKSWPQLKWDKKKCWWTGFATLELLNKLAGIIPLPEIIMAEKNRIGMVQDAVDAERVKAAEDVKPIADYPIKKKMFTHQVRAANMCLLTFGLVKPP